MMMAMERSFHLAITCLLLLAFAGRAWAQTPLQAGLESKQSEWVLGVPVEFTVSVRNASSATVQTNVELEPDAEEISLFISEDGSIFHSFRGPEWEVGETIDWAKSKSPIKPGAKEQASFSLLWNGPKDATGQTPTEGFAFPHAGTYFVKVKVSSDFGDLMSNVVRLAIRQPQGDDAAIWETLKADKELTRYYGFPNGAPGQGQKLQRLLNKYPNSSHAASMKKVLAVFARQEAEIEEARKASNASQQQH